MELKLELDRPIIEFADKDLATVEMNETVAEAARIMRDHGTGCLLVTEREKFIGIITERDILYKIVASDREPSETKVATVMSSPIHTIPYNATAGDAVTKMVALGIRRLGVIKDGKIVGLVTQRSVVAGRKKENVLLPELSMPDRLRCPYCDGQVKDRAELSRHIDLLHIGKGLLEGDLRKW